MYRFHNDYPRVRQSLGEAALREAYPTLLLSLTGEIRGVNPLALWLWDGLLPGELLQGERLLGVNVYNMIARNFDRLPVEHNEGLYARMSAIVKNGLEHHHSIDYKMFVECMLAHPDRAAIFESSKPYVADERDFTIRILHPFQPLELLEYEASTFRVEGDGGFLLIYYPQGSTVETSEEINNRLVEKYGEGDDAIMLQHGESTHVALRKRTSSPYRSYYPCFIQDPLWYLIDENEAHRLLVGASVLNLHFFEMFLSPLVKFLLGPIQDSTAPRALRYFDFFTSRFLREDHEMHEKYMQTMQRLLSIDGFKNLLSLSRQMQIRLSSQAHMNVLTASEDPFYACLVILPWRYNSDIRLEFKSMVNFIYEPSIAIDLDKRSYQDTLVPANSESDAALMLLPLFAAPPSAADAGEGEARQIWYYLWLLALLSVVEEGLSMSEENTQWNPEDAFRRARQSLALRYSPVTNGTARSVKLDILATLDVLERRGKIEKVRLLALLHSFMVTQPHLLVLSELLERELEM